MSVIKALGEILGDALCNAGISNIHGPVNHKRAVINIKKSISHIIAKINTPVSILGIIRRALKSNNRGSPVNSNIGMRIIRAGIAKGIIGIGADLIVKPLLETPCIPGAGIGL